MTRRTGNRPLVLGLLAALLTSSVAAASAVVLGPQPAAATPEAADLDADSGTLRATLESTNRAYLQAQTALEQSRQRQALLDQESAGLTRQVADLERGTRQIAVAAYRTGGLTTVSALVSSGSPSVFLDRATALAALAVRHDRQLRIVTATHHKLAEKRSAAEREIADQQRQLTEMAQRQRQVEQALAAAGTGQVTTPPTGSGPAAGAIAVARPSSASSSPEACSQKDPTTSGCVTPRLLNALQQTQAAGFTRVVSCYRSGGSGEHPKGRACDFAASASGFGGAAGGDDRIYGDNLAAYLVTNASPLAVLYVIWYRQIWMPTTGWRAYTSGDSGPSGSHTNHVHLSVT